jgi:hypothetical protein
MANILPISSGSRYPSKVDYIPREVWDIVDQVARKILIGEIILLFSAVTAVAGMGCLGLVVVYQMDLFVPAVVLLIASAVSGPFGQNMIEAGQAERNLYVRDGLAHWSSKPRVVRTYVEGQPIGLENEGNTCFINAVFQMIMNDTELTKAIREGFEAQIPHYEKFSTVYAWLLADSDTVPEDQDILHTMGIIRKVAASNLTDVLKGFAKEEEQKAFRAHIETTYPIFQGMAFGPAVDLAAVQVDGLKEELGKMKVDPEMATFFGKLNSKPQDILKGLQAFIAGEKAYQEADQGKKPVAATVGGNLWTSGTLLRGLRELMPEVRYYRQEDAEDFLFALLNWVDGSKYSGLYFDKGIERQFELYTPPETESVTRAELLQQKKERSEAAQHDRDRLDVMPDTLLRRKMDGLTCVLKLEHGLVEGADGEALLQKTLESHPSEGEPVVYIHEGEPKWFKQIADRAVLDPQPERIIVELKRFEYTDRPTKIGCKVHMKEKVKIGNEEYQLKSIVHHSGIAGFGHYTSYICKDGKWWYCSDEDVFLTTNISSGLDTGYLYFYEKITKVV